VLTSSGHGGRFSFGVISRKQAAASAEFMDRAFDDAFGIATRKTLAINCLPMGVVFSSNLMTVATTSVREDMAVALVEAFGHHYDQIVAGRRSALHEALHRLRPRARHRLEPLSGQRESSARRSSGRTSGATWRRASGSTSTGPRTATSCRRLASAELGLHLLYETPATIRVRRGALGAPAFARDLFGAGAGEDAVCR
jgi:phenylacetate-CoA ligase